VKINPRPQSHLGFVFRTSKKSASSHKLGQLAFFSSTEHRCSAKSLWFLISGCSDSVINQYLEYGTAFNLCWAWHNCFEVKSGDFQGYCPI